MLHFVLLTSRRKTKSINQHLDLHNYTNNDEYMNKFLLVLVKALIHFYVIGFTRENDVSFFLFKQQFEVKDRGQRLLARG